MRIIKIKMDLYLQSMNTNTRRPPPSQSQPPRPPPQNHPSRPPPNNYQPNTPQSGGYNPNFRPQPHPRPYPPPANTPPPQPNYNRPPNNYRPPRQQDYYEPQQNMYQQRQENDYQERSSMNQPYRGPSPPPNQYNQYHQNRGRKEQYDEQTRDQQYNNRNNRRNQENRPNYNQNYDNNNSYQRQNGPTRYNQRQDYHNQPKHQNNWTEQENRRDSRPNGRFDSHQENRNESRQQDIQSKPNFQRRGGLHQNQSYNEPNNNYRGRGRGRGREFQNRSPDLGEGVTRGRGRGRGRGRQFPPPPPPPQKKQVQKQSEQNQSQSMSIQAQERDQNGDESIQQSQSRSEQQNSSEQHQESNQPSNEQSGSQQMQESAENQRNIPQLQKSESIDMQRIDVMCSLEQFEERLQTFNMNNNRSREGGMRLDTGRSFAIFEINKRTNQPDIALTLKRFRRSTNRGQDDEEKDETSDCPRSKKGLNISMKHIQKQIMDSDGMKLRDLAFPLPPSENEIQFLHIYDFLWNRMRQMIKDVARLQNRDRQTKEIIQICQQMLRFFILAIREGRLPHQCKLQFDPKMDLESITKILTQLIQIYENTHNKLSKEINSLPYISPNQPEIIGYAILISNDLQNTLNEKLRVRLNSVGIAHPLVNSAEIEKALLVKKAIRMRDYETFYRILESPETDYVQACLLIHNLPLVRRETLRVLQKSSEPDNLTKSRKIPYNIFRRAMRFSANLNQQFQSFCQNIGAQICDYSGQKWVFLSNINETLQDYTVSYAFDFGHNKKQRSLYRKSQSKSGMIDSRMISRQELTKRSWYQGNYIQDCGKYYNRLSPKRLNKQKQIKQNSVQEVQIEQNEEDHESPRKIIIEKKNVPSSPPKELNNLNMQFLKKKKEQLNRQKFLKSLENHIQNLVKRSDIHSQHQRKRGIQILFEFIQVIRISTLSRAICRIRQYTQSQNVVLQALQSLSHYSDQKKQFFDNYYKGTSQFITFGKERKYQRLSQLVETNPPLKESITSQLTRIASEIGLKETKILILFCSSHHLVLSSLHFQLIKNIFKFVSNNVLEKNIEAQVQNICQLKGSKPYFQYQSEGKQNGLEITLKLTLFHYKIESNEQPFFCGYDSIIFLDLHNDNRIFLKLVNEFTQCRARTMKYIFKRNTKLSISMNNIVITTIEKLKQKQTNQSKSKDVWGNNNYLIEQQTKKLSLNLKHNLVQCLSEGLNQNKVKKYQFGGVTITNLLSQIQQNMQFIQPLKKDHSSLECFQKYFSANIRYLKKVYCNMVTQYERYDWKELLLETSYLKPSNQQSLKPREDEIIQYPEEKVNFNILLSKKLQFGFQIIRRLQQMNIQKKFRLLKQKQPYSTNQFLLSKATEQFLGTFQKDERDQSLQVICQNIITQYCSMNFNNYTITGDSRALVSYIFVQLKKYLKHFIILLPKGFRFRLSKSQFQPRLIDDQINLGFFEQNRSHGTSQQKKQTVKFKYLYEDLLQKLLQQLQEEQKQQFPLLRTNPIKRVKT